MMCAKMPCYALQGQGWCMPHVGMTGNADAADFALPKAERLNDSTAGRGFGALRVAVPQPGKVFDNSPDRR